MEMVWIGIGAFLGANARYLMGRAIHARIETAFPIGTMAINVLGSLVIGLLAALMAERYLPNHALRLFLITGFLGGYTTFSSYAFEVIVLAERGQYLRAAAYILGSNTLALAGCAAGVALVRWSR